MFFEFNASLLGGYRGGILIFRNAFRHGGMLFSVLWDNGHNEGLGDAGYFIVGKVSEFFVNIRQICSILQSVVHGAVDARNARNSGRVGFRMKPHVGFDEACNIVGRKILQDIPISLVLAISGSRGRSVQGLEDGDQRKEERRLNFRVGEVSHRVQGIAFQLFEYVEVVLQLALVNGWSLPEKTTLDGVIAVEVDGMLGGVGHNVNVQASYILFDRWDGSSILLIPLLSLLLLASLVALPLLFGAREGRYLGRFLLLGKGRHLGWFLHGWDGRRGVKGIGKGLLRKGWNGWWQRLVRPDRLLVLVPWTGVHPLSRSKVSPAHRFVFR